MDRLLLVPSLAIYAALSFAHLLPGVGGAWPERVARPATVIAVVLHAIAFLVGVSAGSVSPGLPEALSATALGAIVGWLLADQGRLGALGMFLSPLAAVLLGTSLVVPHRGGVAALAAAPKEVWLPLHLGLVFAGVGGFALSFGVGVAYLWVRSRLRQRKLTGMKRLPPLGLLDRIQLRATLFGFVFLTLGIAVGGAWAAATLPEPWAFDPKVVFTGVVWLWYGAALQGRLLFGLTGRWSALASIVGFAGMVFSLLVINVLFSTFHGYGS